MDLNNLSLQELKALQGDVDVAIHNFEKRKKAEALAEVERVAKENGFSLKELLGEGKNGTEEEQSCTKICKPLKPRTDLVGSWS